MRIVLTAIIMLALAAGAACASAAPPAVATATLAPPAATATAASTPTQAAGESAPPEVSVQEIPISGPAAEPAAEFSGMAWFGETLILLPQYPQRFKVGEADGAVLALHKADILAALSGTQPGPLEPQLVPLIAPELSRIFSGFEGFEAIAFSGNRAFLTVETSPGDGMMGYLVAGEMAEDLSALRLDPSRRVELPPQARLSNMTDEAILLSGEQIYTFYEAYGQNVNPNPVARTFTTGLETGETVAFPNMEYRITDVSALDEAGNFWAINYFFPGDIKLRPAPDPLAERYGEGASHRRYDTVERLVEFHLGQSGIELVDRPPVQLALIDDDQSRNWEGLVRLNDRGFLLVTDKFPETILAFVPFP